MKRQRWPSRAKLAARQVRSGQQSHPQRAGRWFRQYAIRGMRIAGIAATAQPVNGAIFPTPGAWGREPGGRRAPAPCRPAATPLSCHTWRSTLKPPLLQTPSWSEEDACLRILRASNGQCRQAVPTLLRPPASGRPALQGCGEDLCAIRRPNTGEPCCTGRCPSSSGRTMAASHSILWHGNFSR